MFDERQRLRAGGVVATEGRPDRRRRASGRAVAAGVRSRWHRQRRHAPRHFRGSAFLMVVTTPAAVLEATTRSAGLLPPASTTGWGRQIELRVRRSTTCTRSPDWPNAFASRLGRTASGRSGCHGAPGQSTIGEWSSPSRPQPPHPRISTRAMGADAAIRALRTSDEVLPADRRTTVSRRPTRPYPPPAAGSASPTRRQRLPRFLGNYTSLIPATRYPTSSRRSRPSPPGIGVRRTERARVAPPRSSSGGSTRSSGAVHQPGTEATMFAIRAARARTGSSVATFERAYRTTTRSPPARRAAAVGDLTPTCRGRPGTA